MDLRFTDEANNDLNHIHQFLIQVGVAHASDIMSAIIKAADNLRTFPRMGLPVAMLKQADEVRDYYYKDFCLRYLISADCIYILRIWHQRENERNEPT